MKSTVKYHTDNQYLISEGEFNPAFLGKYEAIFSLGNGYMGARSATEEHYVGEKRDTFINGTFDKFDQTEVTELPNVPDVFGVDIKVNDNALDLTQGEVNNYQRTLDTQTGELTRRFTWSINNTTIEFKSSRFISMKNRHLAGSKITVTPLSTGITKLAFTTGIDGTMSNSGSQHFNDGEKRLYHKDTLQYSAVTNQSNIQFVITSGLKLIGVEDVHTKTEMPRRELLTTFELDAEQNQTITLEKLSTFLTSIDNDLVYQDKKSLQNTGLKATEAVLAVGYDQLLSESAQEWNHIVWNQMPIKIETDDIRDALAINFARYHLQIMTPRHDARMNIGAKGLTGEGYKGHTFWDTELFMLPYFIFNFPETARKLVTYRFLGLKGAREKAAFNSYQGAQYPWEAAWIEDGESTPVWGAADLITGKATKIWSGFIEQHITADVAYGLNEYVEATGDQELADQMGYEVIFDTARFWASRLEWSEEKQRYEINDVIGPDEYKEHANNNAFTNYMAEWNMSLALDKIKKLRDSNATLYQKLDQKLDLTELEQTLADKIDKLYLPKPNQDHIIPEDDAYLGKKVIDLAPYLKEDQLGSLFDHFNLDQVNQMQITKQADVILLLMLFEKHFAKNVKRANWNYYEPKTTHDSSLSLLTHSIVAADLGEKNQAYEFYQRARDIDMGPNMKSSDEGVHAASLGGIWEMTIFGFGGVRYLDGNLRINPNLPKAWNKLDFYLWWHGQKLHIIEQHDQLTIENTTKTKEVVFEHAGTKIRVLNEPKTINLEVE